MDLVYSKTEQKALIQRYDVGNGNARDKINEEIFQKLLNRPCIYSDERKDLVLQARKINGENSYDDCNSLYIKFIPLCKGNDPHVVKNMWEKDTQCLSKVQINNMVQTVFTEKLNYEDVGTLKERVSVKI